MDFKNDYSKFQIRPDTFFIGQNVIWRKKVDSTNKVAQRLLQQQELKEGTTVIAYNQYAGKGRYSRSWESAPGLNITLSIILYPGFLNPQHQFYLTATLALGLISFARRIVIPYQPFRANRFAIKWPNDIYYKDKKLAGILTEADVSPQLIKSAVTGIGVNINQFTFPAHLPSVTSLGMITGTALPLKHCFEVLLEAVEEWYLTLREEQYSHIKQAYEKNMLGFRQTNSLLFKQEEEQKERKGYICGVTEEGKLRIEVDGQEMLCMPGEVEFLE